MKKLLLLLCALAILPFSGDNASAENLKLFFRFGESVAKTWFRNNDATFASIDSLFQRMSRDEAYSVRIVGSASPEGEEAFNMNLSKERAQFLQQYICEKHRIADTLCHLEYLGANGVAASQSSDLRYAEVAIRYHRPVVAAVVEEALPDSALLVAAEIDTAGDANRSFAFMLLLVLLVLLIIAKALWSVKDRISLGKGVSFDNKYMPSGNSGGIGWKGQRGHSDLILDRDFIPGNLNDNCHQHTWGKLMEMYEFSTIAFRGGNPDFSGICAKLEGKKCAVKIDDFTTARYTRDREDGGIGNFEQADRKLAKMLGKDWTEAKVREWRNNAYYTWHEMPGGAMQLVPKLVHDHIPHAGGISHAKRL